MRPKWFYGMYTAHCICQFEKIFPELYDIFWATRRILLFEKVFQGPFIGVFEDDMVFSAPSKASVISYHILVRFDLTECCGFVVVVCLCAICCVFFNYKGILIRLPETL